jgi:two-component system nitrate/nitrite response regulator NarL
VITVAILADIRLYREGLAEVLGRQPDIRVVGTAGNDTAGVQRVVHCAPDVALVDMAMPGSASIARSLAATGVGVKVLALAVPETESHVLACAEVGVAGYVPREGSLDDLLAALLQRFADRRTPKLPSQCTDRLTTRELQIVGLIDQCLTNKEIAERLFIELATVKNHVHNILEKLQIRGRSEAAAWIRAQRCADRVATGDLDRWN